MTELESLPKKERKRLSVISDIIIFGFFVLISVLLIKRLNISFNNELAAVDSVEDVVSLSESSVDSNSLIQEENKEMILKIKKRYGISVLYGKDVKDFANRLDATEQNDIYIVNNNLKSIKKALEKYPISTFYMSLSKTNPIYIMLVDNFSNDNIALASRNSLNEYRMYISNTQKFERAFHHEMYHIMEYFMAYNNSNIYYSWDDLNPKGFSYNEDTSTLTKDYVYIKDDNIADEKISDNAYFVTRYSKTTPKEDRAEIFAELMILNNTPSYLTYGKNIRRKVDLMSNTIDYNLTVDNFYYDKFIK